MGHRLLLHLNLFFLLHLNLIRGWCYLQFGVGVTFNLVLPSFIRSDASSIMQPFLKSSSTLSHINIRYIMVCLSYRYRHPLIFLQPVNQISQGIFPSLNSKISTYINFLRLLRKHIGISITNSLSLSDTSLLFFFSSQFSSW